MKSFLITRMCVKVFLHMVTLIVHWEVSPYLDGLFWVITCFSSQHESYLVSFKFQLSAVRVAKQEGLAATKQFVNGIRDHITRDDQPYCSNKEEPNELQ